MVSNLKPNKRVALKTPNLPENHIGIRAKTSWKDSNFDYPAGCFADLDARIRTRNAAGARL